jgi:hypothetical protein
MRGLELAARHNGGCDVVDWDGVNGLEGLVATGVWGAIEGVDACEGKWRVQGHDRLFSCTPVRPLPVIFQWGSFLI